MKGSLRWQTLVPRLLFLVVALLAAQFVLGRLVRSTAIRTGEAATGAGVEVVHARVSLLNREMVLSDVRVADPSHPEETQFEADRCQFTFAANPLLHRQTVVETGRVTGLRFATHSNDHENLTDGVAESNPAAAWFGGNSDAAASKWLNLLAKRFGPEMMNQFESVQRTNALCTSWSTQAAELDARGTELERRAGELQAAYAGATTNPLRNDKFYIDLPSRVADLQKDFAAFRAELDSLPDRLEAERRAIVAARHHDEQLTRKRMQLDKVEPKSVTTYLLRERAAEPLGELVGWLRWMRSTIPGGELPRPSAIRGENVLFAGCNPAPGVLIKSLQLHGSARISGQPVELQGSLTDYSSQPALHVAPIRLRLRTTGSMPLELQATMDRTRRVPHDQLLLDCQGILLPATALGRANELSLAVAPSVGTLSVSVTVNGENLSGEIQMVQQNVRITPAVGGNFAAVPIAGALDETLGNVNSLATSHHARRHVERADVYGLVEPGPAMVEAIERSVDRVSGQHAKLMLVEAGKQVDERLAGVERQMTEQQSRLNTTLAGIDKQLQTLVLNESPRDRISPERVGRRLPASSLFR